MRGQCEMAEIIGPELQFEAVRGHSALRGEHHPGIVDQQVKAVLSPRKAFCKSRDRNAISEIELLEPNIAARDHALYAADRIGTFASIPSCEDDGSTGPYERQGIFVP